MIPKMRDAPLSVSEKEPQARENQGVDPSDKPEDRGQRGGPPEGTCGERNDVHRNQGSDGQFLDNDRELLGRRGISLND